MLHQKGGNAVSSERRDLEEKALIQQSCLVKMMHILLKIQASTKKKKKLTTYS